MTTTIRKLQAILRCYIHYPTPCSSERLAPEPLDDQVVCHTECKNVKLLGVQIAAQTLHSNSAWQNSSGSSIGASTATSQEFLTHAFSNGFPSIALKRYVTSRTCCIPLDCNIYKCPSWQSPNRKKRINSSHSEYSYFSTHHLHTFCIFKAILNKDTISLQTLILH
jgi:hypothetical protein